MVYKTTSIKVNEHIVTNAYSRVKLDYINIHITAITFLNMQHNLNVLVNCKH